MAIRKVRMPDGTDVVLDEWLHWPSYSTIEVAAGSAINIRAFTYVVGQRVPQQGAVAGGARNATEADTNQVARTRVNHDEALLLYSITYETFGLTDAEIATTPTATSVAPVPMTLATNIKRLQRDVVVELRVGAGIFKPQFRAPMEWIHQGVGSPAWTSGDGVAANTAISYGTAGAINPKYQRRWPLPIFIQSDRVFYLQLQSFPGAIADLNQDLRLRWYLDGLKRRPVA